ncbi:MAG TPA: helix-turn-helix domain-containing protein [Ktedonobacteraceae bacterium]|jgi:DNA-binding HxlR family transcriptional regulator|nr:helix-turn-helix domain-containing protein [Ktedonobacteraceae bacterium]
MISQHYQQAINLIGRRWVLQILTVLLTAPHQFMQIEALIGGISSNMLAIRLRELEQEGMIERRVREETPARVEYCLTEKGRAMEEVISALRCWSSR